MPAMSPPRLQPGRQIHRHRQRRPNCPHLGRRHRPTSTPTQRPHRWGHLSRLQPGRQVHRHRQRHQTARIWDAATGQELEGVSPLSGHTGRVNSAAYSPDGKFIVTASYDQTARIWDAATGQELHALSGHTGSVT